MAIGELVWTSNYAHGSLAMMFGALLMNNDLGKAMWFVLRSDKAQRELVMATASVVLKKKPRARKAITWAIVKLNALAELRNDAVHSDVAFDTSTRPHRVLVNPYATLPSRAQRLHLERSLVRTFGTASNDLLKFGGYFFRMYEHLIDPDVPLPKRPRLRWVRARDRVGAPYPHLRA